MVESPAEGDNSNRSNRGTGVLRSSLSVAAHVRTKGIYSGIYVTYMYAIKKAKFKKNFLYTVCNTTMPGTLKLISMTEKLYFLHRSVVWYLMMIV